jgi:anthranilate 1,2-dioxygenase small subunit
MPPVVDIGLRVQIEELLARYVHAIDNDQLESWPDFFLDNGEYLVTTRDNHARKRPIGIMYCDGRGMMQDRVTALRQAIVFEPHTYRHIVGSPLITPAADGSYAAESNFHILRIGADGAVVTYGCGRYLDEIVRCRDGMAFRKRSVVLDSSRIDTLLVIPL